MNGNLITSKIDTLSKEFQSKLNVNLWDNVPHDQIENIANPVVSKDDFIARITSLTAIFDSFNKKAFDRVSGITTKGTRESFITLLKKEFRDDQVRIQNEIEEPIGMICLLRDYIAHGKNKNYEKAFAYFKENHPTEQWKNLWSKVITKFAEVLDSTLSLLRSKDRHKLKSAEINKDLLEILISETLHDIRYDAKDSKCKAILREIASRQEIVDTDLASIFNISVEELRLLLYPFSTNILMIKPNDMNSTKLQIVEFMKERIRTP
jgi:hypothetical protein